MRSKAVRIRGHGTAGFGLVEVLVAIAIVSGLIVAIGMLLASVARVNSRASESGRIFNALIEINALHGFVGRRVDMSLRPIGDGFELYSEEGTGRVVPPARVSLSNGAAATAVEFEREQTVASVDLSVFEAISIEYFVPEAEASLWLQVVYPDSDVQGARLVLRHGARVWRPLVWMKDEYR